MTNRGKIKSILYFVILISLLNQHGSAQTESSSIHEYDLVDMDIEGKIVGGVRDGYLFQKMDRMQLNISRTELILGLYGTLLQMKLFESKRGIIITPNNGFNDNSTGLKGETLLFNITIIEIIHGSSEIFVPSVAYVNPKLSRFSDFVRGFGLLIAIVLTMVLFKTVFDYLKIRNLTQSIIK